MDNSVSVPSNTPHCLLTCLSLFLLMKLLVSFWREAMIHSWWRILLVSLQKIDKNSDTFRLYCCRWVRWPTQSISVSFQTFWDDKRQLNGSHWSASIRVVKILFHGCQKCLVIEIQWSTFSCLICQASIAKFGQIISCINFRWLFLDQKVRWNNKMIAPLFILSWSNKA